VYQGGTLFGRAGERKLASAAAAGAAHGEGGVLTVAGEPGVGKTALIRAVAAGATAEHGARVLWGDCYEGSAQTPFGPWDAAFAAVGGLALPSPEGLSSPDARLALFAAASAALAKARAGGPLVVVVDDLHWASPDSVELFGYLATRAGATGILLVGAYRDPDPSLERPDLSALLGRVAPLPNATSTSAGSTPTRWSPI
jgi:predicted ATPase